ncbi:MAG: hypothetical protein Fues2KO_38620 [Fuerstiella sp.]
MSLINASLLGGLLLAGLPILLHMIMRARPKRIEFPALRLLQARRISNARRLRLRHILLLTLRTMVIILIVLALARPSLPPARYRLLWYEWCLLLGVVVATIVVYRKLSARLNSETKAAHLQTEQRGRLRAFSLLGGLLAAIVAVGLPWGLRVQGEVTGPRNSMTPDLPAAAVFVFDTSQSMSYKHESRTRLEQARDIALDHLSVLPSGSRVAVSTLEVDSEPIFQADLAGVRSRIDDLRTEAVVRPLNAVLQDAIEVQIADRESLQQQSGSGDAFVREVYLLTDLSVAGWDLPDESGLRDLLVQHDWLQIYLIDVSVSNPINVALGRLRFDRETTTSGQSVNLSVTVSATAAAPLEAALELFTIDADGIEIRGGAGGGNAVQTVQFQGTPPVATFSVRASPGADVQRGYIRLSNPDPLQMDDVRYFAFGVSAVPRVLLVADREIDAWLFRNALQPVAFEALGEQRYNCTTVTGAEFGRTRLENFDVVCILNWTRPDQSVWPQLRRFVEQGGGLFVATGGRRDLQPAFWSTNEAIALLPGIPLAPLPFRDRAAQLSMVAESHPIVKSFVDSPEALTEIGWPVFHRVWSLDQSADATVLMEYNDRNRRPALLERPIGRGTVLQLTTAVDNDREWNEGFTSDDSWAFLMLTDQIMQYLTGASSVQRNFLVGQPVQIEVPPSRRFQQYAVARPRLRLTEGTLDFNEDSVLLQDIDEAGHYQIRSADEGNAWTFDFAANGLPDESNLQKISADELDEVLGEGRYSRVRDPQELDRAVNLGRLGIEVFPILMGLLVLLFISEHLMANYFYEEESSPASIPAAST